MTPRRRITLEGNIGAGKSTLLAILQELRTRDDNMSKFDLCIVPEPVDQWELPLLEGGTKSMLEAFYEDPARNGFAFQMFVLLTRMRSEQAISSALSMYSSSNSNDDDETNKKTLVVTERCLASDFEIFGRSMRAQGAMNDAEWETYRQWWASSVHSTDTLSVDAVIYLRTPPEECMRRVERRGRHAELVDADESDGGGDGDGDGHNNKKRGGVDLEYLAMLHEMHEAWVKKVQKDIKVPVLVLDGTAPSDDLTREMAIFFEGIW